MKQKKFLQAQETIDLLEASLGKLGSETKRISIETRVAVLLSSIDGRDAAAKRLNDIEARARTQITGDQQSIALKYVAAALAEIERPDQALSVLDDIALVSERTSVLISAATAQAKAGDAAAALATAETIEAVRYRAVLLGKIALSQANKRNFSDADTTLDSALAAIDKITLPYARSFAISRIALSISKVETLNTGLNSGPSSTIEKLTWPRFKKAIEIAAGIDDNRLRAHALWTISSDQRRAGDVQGSSATEDLAVIASGEIKSHLTQVWMYSELASVHAAFNEPAPGWQAFERGLAIASEINNPWGRARALAKLAQTLIDLVVPEPSHQ